MAQDQTVNYRVNIDDSNFQAKLTQMRASLDSTVGGMSGAGGFGRTMAYLGPMGGGNFNGGISGGLADFGAMVSPVTYTPPAIAMQPHFGMFQIQQTLSQAGLAAFGGPSGVALSGIRANGILSQKEYLPPQISYSEYMGYSTRSFADRMGATASSMVGTGMSIGADLLATSAATGIASAMGMGMLGTVGLGIAASAAVATVPTAAASRAADQLGIQSTLASGSFRAYQGSNTDPLTGRGFNRQDRFNIATGLARMESNDARFNMNDYRQIMETGMQMDLFSGTKDAEDFQKKFKGLVDTVKTVSSTLHTSLKEGLETIRGLRDMGITDPVMQQSTIMRSEVLGRMSGKTGMEMMAVGQTGAEIFRGTGINMQRGFELNQQNTAMVQQMLNQGNISRDTVAQMGGVNAAGQQMTAGALASFQTTLGRGALMASFNPTTGELDSGMVANMAKGDTMSFMGRAAGMASSPGNMAKFIAHQEELISKMSPGEMQAFGMAQTMQMARTLQQNFGGDLKDWYVTAGKQYQGKSKEIMDVEMGMLTMDPIKYKEQMMTQNANMAAQQNLEAARNNYLGPKFLTNAFTRLVTQPLSESITGFGNDVSRTTENIAQDVRQAMFGGAIDARQLNAATVSASDKFLEFEAKDRFQKATAGRNLTPEEAKAEAKKAADEVLKGEGGTVTDISEKGVFDYIGSLGGGKGTGTGELLRTIETNMAKDGTATVNGRKVKTYGSRVDAEIAARKAGEHLNILGTVKDKEGRDVLATLSDEDMGAIATNKRNMQVSDEEIETEGRKIEKHRDYLESTGQMTVTKLGRTVVKDFTMKKFLSGDLKKTDYARMLAAARLVGDKSLEEIIARQTGSEALGEVGTRAAAASTSTLGDLRSDIRGGLKDVLGGGALDVFGSHAGWDSAKQAIDDDAKQGGIMNAINALNKGNTSAAEKFLTATGGGGAGLDSESARRLLTELKLAKKEDPKEFAKLANKSVEALRLISDTKMANVALAGSELGAAGGIAGDISAKSMEAMVNMMKTFEMQLKIVQALQESFKASLKMK